MLPACLGTLNRVAGHVLGVAQAETDVGFVRRGAWGLS